MHGGGPFSQERDSEQAREGPAADGPEGLALVSPEERDSNRLIARFQAGDSSGFVALYLRYVDRVYGYVRVTIRDAHDADDLTQQVFLHALNALPRYEIRQHQGVKPWLFRIARNEAIDYLTLRRRTHVVELDEVTRRRDEIEVDSVQSTLEWITDGDLLMLIERLSLAQRQVIVLRNLVGLTTAEIAQVLDRTPVAVRQLEHRALRFLETRLTALGRAPVRLAPAFAVALPRHGLVTGQRRLALASY